MLSDHERKALGQIQSDLAASDPAFARVFARGDLPPAPRRIRVASLIWITAITAAFLNLVSLAIGLTTAAFLFGSLTLGAVAAGLRWPPSGSRPPTGWRLPRR